MPGLHNQPKTNTTPKSRKSVFETPNVPIKEVRGAVLDNTKSLRVRLEAIGQARLLALGGEVSNYFSLKLTPFYSWLKHMCIIILAS